MESFFQLKTSEEVFRIIDQFGPSGDETIPLEDALGRVLRQDIRSEEDLPHFFRSVMDGYAVRARDTFGAGESLPALLEIEGEVLMGQDSGMVVGQGQAVRISTGGMLPEKADGVVMVEHTHLLDENTLEVSRAISPLENTIQPGDDFRKGEIVFRKGHVLRPQDLGLLAGLGQAEVFLYPKPRVAIISTGDEIVSINDHPGPGQVRDINRYTLGALCRRAGADPVHTGLSSDNFESLKEMVENAIRTSDTVWISGGSSVGTRDMTLKVFEGLRDFELLVHGISISPGKPTIIGRADSKPIIGLPGHVASALVVAEVFLTRLISRLSGCTDTDEGFHDQVEAILSRNLESASGREDYIRVKLTQQGERLLAEPIFGKSGLISTLVEADGLIRIDMNTEGIYEGQRVKVLLNGGLR
jgi:molybdopterin molybdotransferase